MADNESSTDTVDRALRLFVYGPVGLACYLKDSAPTFMGLFVSRGKREVDGARKVVEERLGLSRSEPVPSPQQRVADGIGNLSKVAAQATALVASMAGPVVTAATNVATGGSTATASTPPAAPATPTAPAASPDTAAADTAASGAGADLPISGYDGLSASQVIERLEGMSGPALEQVRRYEQAHRARRTILASIDQRTA